MRRLAQLLRRWADRLDPVEYTDPPSSVDLKPQDPRDLMDGWALRTVADLPEYGSSGPHCVDHVPEEFGVYL